MFHLTSLGTIADYNSLSVFLLAILFVCNRLLKLKYNLQLETQIYKLGPSIKQSKLLSKFLKNKRVFFN